MPLELTTGDYLEIRAALGERFPIDERDRAIYRAGLAAGIERAAMIADDVTWDSEYHDMWHVGFDAAAKACAAAIKALLK